jgi:hypothetical protein
MSTSSSSSAPAKEEDKKAAKKQDKKAAKKQAPAKESRVLTFAELVRDKENLKSAVAELEKYSVTNATAPTFNRTIDSGLFLLAVAILRNAELFSKTDKVALQTNTGVEAYYSKWPDDSPFVLKHVANEHSKVDVKRPEKAKLENPSDRAKVLLSASMPALLLGEKKTNGAPGKKRRAISNVEDVMKYEVICGATTRSRNSIVQRFATAFGQQSASRTLSLFIFKADMKRTFAKTAEPEDAKNNPGAVVREVYSRGAGYVYLATWVDNGGKLDKDFAGMASGQPVKGGVVIQWKSDGNSKTTSTSLEAVKTDDGAWKFLDPNAAADWFKKEGGAGKGKGKGKPKPKPKAKAKKEKGKSNGNNKGKRGAQCASCSEKDKTIALLRRKLIIYEPSI